MIYVRYLWEDKVYCGIVQGNMISRLKGSFLDESIEYTGVLDALEDAKILPPTLPSKIVAAGLNYKDHAAEMGEGIPSFPKLFIKPSTAVIGHEDTIILPDSSERVDYEAELAIVIKKTCKNVKAGEAKDYILGYTCLNDVTARDLQGVDGQWTRAKGFDTFCPIGPVITDEVNPNSLNIRLLLNGQVMQSSNTREFIFNTDMLVEMVSQIMTLLPGDVITTGTPGGIGPMQAGDTVKVEIENVGTLLNYLQKG